ncbi:DUF2341 domain-containing protein [Salibacter halophilus]|nr:DUF2341 domain-containing protein [Salibacter halophilus]
MLIVQISCAQFSNYNYFKKVTINSSQISGSSEISPFTAYFSFSHNDLRSVSNGGHVESTNGYDIVFSNDFCGQIHHEIESYDPATGELSGWVQIPTISAIKDTSIYIIYGNPSISSSQENTSAWNSEYLSVWHLENTLDATANSHDFNMTKGTPQNTTGKVGGAKLFDGNGDYYTDSDGENYIDGLTEYTFSIWLKPQSNSVNAGVFFGGNRNQNMDRYFSLRYDQTGSNCSGTNVIKHGINRGSTKYTGESNSNIQTINWQHVVVSWQAGSPLDLHVNGNPVGFNCFNGSTFNNAINQTKRFILGASSQSDWDGKIDEAHFLNVKKSDDWIATYYNNQNDPSTFMTLGSEQEIQNFSTASSGNWSAGSTWSGGIAPNSAGAIVTINHDINVDGDFKTSSVTVNSGNTINVNNSQSLIVQCGIDNSGSLTVENNGALVQYSESDLNTGSGNYTYKREGISNMSYFNSWSSPVQNQQIAGSGGVFQGSNPCDMLYFDAASQSWKYDFPDGYSTTCKGNSVTFNSNNVISGGDNMINTGEGYFIAGDSVNPVRIFEGQVHNGPISVGVLNPNVSPGGSWDGKNWNLIGNPYPSAIYIEAFREANSSILDSNSAVYLWDNQSASYNQSDYVTVNNSGFINSNDQTYSTPPTSISAGQGFMVAASQDGNVTFDNSMRVVGDNDRFYKNSNGQGSFPKFWVRVTHPNDVRNDVLIAFNENATDGLDPDYDAPKNSAQNYITVGTLMSGDDSTKYAIQGLSKSSLYEELSIPLSVEGDSSGTYRFELFSTKGNIDQPVYLYDKKDDVKYNLTSSQAEVELDKNQDQFRFVIQLDGQAPPLSSNKELQSNSSEKVNVFVTEEFIKLQADKQKNFSQIQLYNLQGKNISFVRNANKIETPEVTGVYLLKYNSHGNTITEKLLIP